MNAYWHPEKKQLVLVAPGGTVAARVLATSPVRPSQDPGAFGLVPTNRTGAAVVRLGPMERAVQLVAHEMPTEDGGWRAITPTKTLEVLLGKKNPRTKMQVALAIAAHVGRAADVLQRTLASVGDVIAAAHAAAGELGEVNRRRAP